ncbi:MAG: SDR family oxidoreductase [Dehalococcoidia bacterium]|nr:SDR family oxidoreductase [Dehalococcoidia bacterium]
MKKRVVVTGGAGFIGSHLAVELARRGCYITIIDDLSTGKKENIEGLLSKGNVQFVHDSITNLPLLQQLSRNADWIFHQAAIASVPSSIDNPLASHEVNVTGTLNVLLAARDNGVRKVVVASSCAIYGDPVVLPVCEHMPSDLQSPYAATKLAMEHYCDVFQRVYNLPSICLRYFNVYGPGQSPDSQYAAVVPKFIQHVREGNSPAVFGDGEQTRDFVFVRDVVEANILAAESDVTGIFNIGSGEHISLNTLAEKIIRLMNKDVRTIHKEPRLGDIRHSLADISKAQIFGYRPKYDLESGLREILGRLN